MKFFIKKVIKAVILRSLRLLFFGKIGAFIQNETTKYIVNKTLLVLHNDCSLRLSVPNGVCNFRAITFENKVSTVKLILTIDAIKIQKIKIIVSAPKKPNSSEIKVKIKSVCFSGK